MTEPLIDSIAAGILDWCGVSDPTPVQVRAARLASSAAQGTIKEYRGLNRAKPWQFDTVYGVNAIVQPSIPNGHLYICTDEGTSDDETEPTWPTTTGETVDDNDVTWTEYTHPFETRFTDLAIEMGVYQFRKRGMDGVMAFGENGVQMSFEKGSYPPSMLSRIPLGTMTG